MPLPFSPEAFIGTIRGYNVAVWPAQWALVALGVAVAALAWRGGRGAGRAAGWILAVLWGWMAIVYHLVFFMPVNPAASIFAAAFTAQAALLAWAASRGRLRFGARTPAQSAPGATMLLLALAGYPVLAIGQGHVYPGLPTFGLPCPTTILTLGVLTLADTATPYRLYVIPLLWAAIGLSAASSLGMHEDLTLPVAAVAAIGELVRRRRRYHPPRHARA